MKRCFYGIFVTVLLMMLLAGCYSRVASSDAPDPSSTVATIPVSTMHSTTEVPTTESPVTTAGSNENSFVDSATNTEQVDDYLFGLFDELNAQNPDANFSSSWTDGDLVILIYMPSFDQYYEITDLLSEDDRATVRDLSHAYVSGELAQSLYNAVRRVGGDGFDVYFFLTGSEVFCASKNLQIFMDPLNE